jgi:hypothetical protein
MTRKEKFTPAPWVYEEGFILAKDYQGGTEFSIAKMDNDPHCDVEANAALIVRAVNRDQLFGELLEASKAMLCDIKKHAEELPPIPAVCELWARLDEVVAKAEASQ